VERLLARIQEGGGQSTAASASSPAHVFLPVTSRAAAASGNQRRKKDSKQTRDNLAFQLQQEKYQSEDLKDAIKKVIKYLKKNQKTCSSFSGAATVADPNGETELREKE